MKRMIETVHVKWDAILRNSKEYPKPGTTVSVTFFLDLHGNVRIKQTNASTHAAHDAVAACISAINDPAPFQRWTDEMIAVLGREQQMTFTFYYE